MNPDVEMDDQTHVNRVNELSNEIARLRAENDNLKRKRIDPVDDEDAQKDKKPENNNKEESVENTHNSSLDVLLAHIKKNNPEATLEDMFELKFEAINPSPELPKALKSWLQSIGVSWEGTNGLSKAKPNSPNDLIYWLKIPIYDALVLKHNLSAVSKYGRIVDKIFHDWVNEGLFVTRIDVDYTHKDTVTVQASDVFNSLLRYAPAHITLKQDVSSYLTTFFVAFKGQQDAVNLHNVNNFQVLNRHLSAKLCVSAFYIGGRTRCVISHLNHTITVPMVRKLLHEAIREANLPHNTISIVIRPRGSGEGYIQSKMWVAVLDNKVQQLKDLKIDIKGSPIHWE